MQLLSKTVRSYLIYCVVIIICSIPTLYFLLYNFIRHESEEALHIRKEHIIKSTAKLHSVGELQQYIQFHEDLTITPLDSSIEKTDEKTSKIFEYDSISQENIPFAIFSFPLEFEHKKYRIDLRESLIEREELMELILSIQISVLMLLLAGLFFINKNLASKIWTPFYQILEKVKEIEVNRDAELNLPKTNIREFEDLKQAILYLAKKNRRVYQVQKEFTENAAHEMQTPLAIFQSKLELLMQSMNLNEEQANLIESLLNVSQRLSRLNRSLLLLAKIENEQFIEKEEIDVCEVIQALIGQFSEQFRYQKIKSDIHLPNPIYLKANTTLLEILFSNLISNAIKYNLEQGIFLLNSNSRNEIIISNSGRLSAVHSADMFERFTKNASAQEGIGLGLAIVKKICDTCHYQIDYHFDNDLRLHHFKVKF